MKVAMLGAKGVPATMGGVERHVEELGARLAAGGIAVTAYARPWYVSRAPWSEFQHRGMRVITLPSVATKHLDAITHTFVATIHAVRERHDVYHFHGVGPALLAWIPRVLHPAARVIVTFHCVDRRHAKWGRFARAALSVGEWAACRFPNETITVGATLAAYCEERFHRTTTYIPNGVAPPRIRTPESDHATLRRFGLVPQQYILSVTRLVRHKGVHTTIAAFQQLQRERAELRGLKLAIVGDAAFTDAYRDELVVQAGGNANVLFLGRQNGEALDALYANCLVFVHASVSEGLPLVLLEAAAAGVVPLVSDIPEHREVIERTGGVLFRSEDVWDMFAKLEILIRSASSLPALGATLRDAVLTEYGWNAICDATRSRYGAPTTVGEFKRQGHVLPIMRPRPAIV